MPTTKKPTLSFEQQLSRIDEIVRALDGGGVSLDESLKLFEEGTKLIRQAQETLQKAEQTVVRLSKGADGEPVEAPFPDLEA
ncbi:MAG: exodeoxyribonuclease VII small subunit [Oscillospiraceae bacterium]|jgi:exodeoxyribonuclease VII small subunit|nr:exodeoxyribonuclease VII small subunit [Oscillospiraceae bacterium]